MNYWTQQANSTQSAADRQEFVAGVLGYKGPGLGAAIGVGVLAWYLLRERNK